MFMVLLNETCSWWLIDDIDTVITNNGQDINLDIMNTNQKIPKPASLIPPSIQPISDLRQVLNNENEEKIEWDKTDNKD